MSSELLRRAAEKLRHHARASYLTPGPWESLDSGDRLVHFRKPGMDYADGLDFEYVVDEPMNNASNAEYIALMHPPVALALADWLDGTVERIERLRPALTGAPSYTPDKYAVHLARHYAHPFAVARAVLREPDPTGGTDG